MRLRDLDLSIGTGQPGPLNAITDLAGVLVGHATIVSDEQPIARTGVTVIRPRAGHVRDDPLFAGVAVLNGNGDCTGFEWIRESGLLTTPIALTNTHSVGVVRDALVAHDVRASTRSDFWSMPVVAETYDGFLNDITAAHVRAEHVTQALGTASSGPVREGAVGGGTGMICYEFKGGIGTASRVVAAPGGSWTVGVLVQANHGERADLRVNGCPVGAHLGTDRVPSPRHAGPAPTSPPGAGSIVLVVGTDAPLLPDQCTRLARRAFVGLARSGGGCADYSGDVAIAFSTAQQDLAPEYLEVPAQPRPLHALPHQSLNPLFEAVAEASEEAILNALLAAATTTGRDGRIAHGLTAGLLLDAVRRSNHLTRTTTNDRGETR